MKEVLKEKAYAKLNLSLDVGKVRPDGYHEMTMLMQTVSLCDEIEITVNDSGIVRAETGLAYIPGDERNLAVRAAKLYLNHIGRADTGADIRIRKFIPVGAGMAGGSTDAAAVFRALNRFFGDMLSCGELLALSKEVGSDVPFCATGGTALASGRGEILTPVAPLRECAFVICKPPFSISTPELFKKLDGVKITAHPDTKGMLSALEDGDLERLCRRMYNVFEDCGDRRMRDISAIKGKLLDLGAMGAVMTGTGSAVFGVFRDSAEAEKAAKKMESICGFSVAASPVGRLLE